jgi:hypothetical protein
VLAFVAHSSNIVATAIQKPAADSIVPLDLAEDIAAVGWVVAL